MILTPCNTCHLKANCIFRAELRRKLRGTGLTSARFDCQLQRDDMPPGAVVEARLKYVWSGGETFSPDEGSSPDIGPGVLRGIVMAWYAKKVLVYFPDQSGSLWSWRATAERRPGPVEMAKLTPNLLTPTGEREIVCRHCGLPKIAAENDKRLNWVCGNGDDGGVNCEYDPAPAEVLPW